MVGKGGAGAIGTDSKRLANFLRAKGWNKPTDAAKLLAVENAKTVGERVRAVCDLHGVAVETMRRARIG